MKLNSYDSSYKEVVENVSGKILVLCVWTVTGENGVPFSHSWIKGKTEKIEKENVKNAAKVLKRILSKLGSFGMSSTNQLYA